MIWGQYQGCKLYKVTGLRRRQDEEQRADLFRRKGAAAQKMCILCGTLFVQAQVDYEVFSTQSNVLFKQSNQALLKKLILSHFTSSSKFRFKTLTKLQLQNFNEISASKSRPNFSHHCIGAYRHCPQKAIVQH